MKLKTDHFEERENLKEKKRKVAELQNSIEKNQTKLFQVKEDLHNLIEQKAKLELYKKKIDIITAKDNKSNSDDSDQSRIVPA